MRIRKRLCKICGPCEKQRSPVSIQDRDTHESIRQQPVGNQPAGQSVFSIARVLKEVGMQDCQDVVAQREDAGSTSQVVHPVEGYCPAQCTVKYPHSPARVYRAMENRAITMASPAIPPTVAPTIRPTLGPSCCPGEVGVVSGSEGVVSEKSSVVVVSGYVGSGVLAVALTAVVVVVVEAAEVVVGAALAAVVVVVNFRGVVVARGETGHLSLLVHTWL